MATYYKVKELTLKSGEKQYVLYQSKNWLGIVLGMCSIFEKKNKSIDEAIEQLEFVDGYVVKKEKTVLYKTK